MKKIMTNFNGIKGALPETLAAYNIVAVANKTGYVCPNCGNGSGDDGTGIIPTMYNGTPSYYCHRCGAHFDNLDLIALHHNLDVKKDFPKVLAEGATLLGGAAANSIVKPAPLKSKTDSAPADYSEFLAQAFSNIENLPENARRGLSLDTLEHFNCGFVTDWRHPKIQNAPTSRRLIIPTSKSHYLARSIDDSVPKEFAKQHVGKKEIFNLDALKEDFTVLVVEGEADAMSIWQISDGYIPVVAVSGCSNYKMLLNWLDDNPDCHCSFIVVFDNDSKEGNAGQTNAKKFVDELNERGFPAVNRLLSDRQDFDANDWLQENPVALRDRIFDLYDDASNQLEEIAEEIKVNADFNAKVANFESFNGKIPPEFLPLLKDAMKSINALQVEDFDAHVLYDEVMRRSLGLCNFYPFLNSAIVLFLEKFKSAKNFIAKKIKATEPVSDAQKSLLNLTLDDVRKIIKKAARRIEKRHESYQKDFAKEQAKREKFARSQQKNFDRQQALQQLEELKKLPQSFERDQEMRCIIRENCEWHYNRLGVKKNVEPTAVNYNFIFANDPLIDGLFGYDEFAKAIVFLKKPYWYKDNTCIGQVLQRDDENQLKNYLALNYGEINGFHHFENLVSVTAYKNSFHPIKDFLENLPDWDGTTRAEKLFIDFLDVADTPYSREVTLNMLLAAVARIYHPGCEYQYVPVLQGEQGIGKGYIMKQLGGQGFMELQDKIGTAHAIDATQKGWIIEIPEMAAMRKSKLAEVKAFVSAREDTRRFAYDKRASNSKRNNIFFATANDKFPLVDPTGNRRFIILESPKSRHDYTTGLTKDYVKQVWAEVLVKYNELFKDGFDDHKLLLSRETIKIADEIAERFTEDDGLIGEILAFIDTPIPHKVVWNLLSKEERKRFINEGHITLSKSELFGRQQARRRPSEMAVLEEILADSNDPSITFDTNSELFTFYGAELRDTICAAEIYNECFSRDQRSSMKRISEVLARKLPPEWEKRGRQKCGVYGDQKTVYVREVTDFSNAEEISEVAVTETDEIIQPQTDNQVHFNEEKSFTDEVLIEIDKAQREYMRKLEQEAKADLDDHEE